MATIDRIIGLNGSVGFKAACKAATTASITLSGQQTIDGVAVVAGDRVLVKDQSSSIDNGIYNVSTGSWTRALDFNNARDVVNGTSLIVVAGTASGGLQYRLVATDPIIIGSSSLTFTKTTGTQTSPIASEAGYVWTATGAGAFSWQPRNTSVAVTGAFTLTDSHDGQTIFLTGASFYTVTVGSITRSHFRTKLVNPSTTRSRCINNGGAKQWLKPGQEVEIYNNGGTIVVPTLPRAAVLSPNIYISPTGTSDKALADGFDASSPLSMASGFDLLFKEIDCQGSFPMINGANGTYNYSLQYTGQPVGAPVVFLIGASALGFIWRPTSGGATPYCLLLGNGGVFIVSNVQFDGGGITSKAIQMHQTAVFDLYSGCGFGSHGNSSGGGHIGFDGAGGTLNIAASYAVNGAGGASYHIDVPSPGIVNIAGGITVSISNAPNIGGWYRALGGTINLGASITHSGSVLAGCRKWSVGPAGLINFSGNSGTIPGSVAGSPATGSNPVAATGWAVA